MDERIYDGLIMRYSAILERAGGRRGRSRAGGGARADDAHGQTHQCRFSDRGLDPAGQHHDAGAGTAPAASARAPAATGECAAAVTAPGTTDDSHGAAPAAPAAPKKQPAPKSARAAPVQLAPRRGRSRGRQRLMLSKAGAGR